MSEEIIKVSELTKRFGQVVAIDDLSFNVCKGEILGLVGPDGAGKTTVLRVLAGIMPADSGQVLLDEQDVLREPEAIKSRIGYMPQQYGLYGDLTVTENIRFYADIFQVSQKSRRALETRLLEASGMSPFRDRLAGQLSGGMKRKLGIACALIHKPQLLLLDEPTTGVDPVSRREVWSIVYSLVFEGVTVLISTAYLDEAERCHRLLMMYQGRRLFFGTPPELRAMLPGTVVSIGCADPDVLQPVAAATPGILQSTAIGDELHVVVDDPDVRLAPLRENFERAGLAFGEMRRITATVEDVFVFAISRQQSGQGS